MIWKLPKPARFAMTTKEWHDYHTKMKTEHPFLNWVYEDVPHYWSVRWMFVTAFYWKMQHTYNPRHQYNVIRPKTLKPGYYDPDTLILHSVMCMVSEYITKTKDVIDWESKKGECDKYLEIKHWWEDEWPNRDTHKLDGTKLEELPDLPDVWGTMSVLNEDYEDEPVMVEWRRIAKTHNENDVAWDNKETEMLHKAMDLRSSMWYP